MKNQKKSKSEKSKTEKLTKKSNTIKTPEVLVVEWKDHYSTSNGWKDPEGVDMDPELCTSVGFKVKEDKEFLVLGINKSSHGLVGITMNIMKNCITRINKL